MRFDTKVAVIVRDDLAVWQKLNVACFLTGGLVGRYPELPGERYVDASGRSYAPLVRQPILVFAADADGLKAALRRALARGLDPAIYSAELFATGHDEANRAAVRAVASEDLDLVGLAVHGARKDVDKATKGLKLHG